MNVEIGTEAAQFPEKEYINEIFLAVYPPNIPLYTSVLLTSNPPVFSLLLTFCTYGPPIFPIPAHFSFPFISRDASACCSLPYSSHRSALFSAHCTNVLHAPISLPIVLDTSVLLTNPFQILKFLHNSPLLHIHSSVYT
jgi:hypothetical protein